MRQLAVALLMGGATAAHSHSFFGQGPGFSGALHLLVSPLSLAALAAGIALLHGQPSARRVWSAAVMALAAVVGCTLAATGSVPGWAAPLCVALAGVAAAAGVGGRAPALAWLPAALAGIGVGLAIEFDAYLIAAVLGLGIATGFLTYAALAGLGALSQSPVAAARVRLGLRVIGSWAGAIALLLGALALRVGQHTGA